MPRRILLPALIALVALPGCLFSREIADTRRDIEAAYPDIHLEKQLVLNLGPLSMATLGWMASLVPDPDVEMAREYLKDIRRVKVGVFRTERPDELAKLDIGRLGFEKDWEVAVRSRQDGEHVWVLYKEGPDTIRDIYVVVLSDEDLVVARLRGNLNRLVARAMEDHVDLQDWMESSL